jgi:hypothetical protein
MAHTEEKAHRGEVESGARAACACGPARECCGQNAQAKAHAEHGAHVRDAGGVKAQQLIESIRILPSPKEASGMQREMRVAQRRRQTEGRPNQERARRACGPARECGQNAQAKAHIEHEAHVRDDRGVKAQRLVESSRILPSGHLTHRGKYVWHRGDGTQRARGRIRSARGVRAAQLGSVCEEGAGGSAQ